MTLSHEPLFRRSTNKSRKLRVLHDTNRAGACALAKKLATSRRTRCVITMPVYTWQHWRALAFLHPQKWFIGSVAVKQHTVHGTRARRARIYLALFSVFQCFESHVYNCCFLITALTNNKVSLTAVLVAKITRSKLPVSNYRLYTRIIATCSSFAYIDDVVL